MTSQKAWRLSETKQHMDTHETRHSTTGVLNFFPVNYHRVIKQSTRTPRLAGKTVDLTLLHHNKARSGRIYAEFSIGTHFPLVQDITK